MTLSTYKLFELFKKTFFLAKKKKYEYVFRHICNNSENDCTGKIGATTAAARRDDWGGGDRTI